MTEEERTVTILTCDACKTELSSDYIHVHNATIDSVYNDEVISTLTLEDKHFCNRDCLKQFIEVFI